MGIVMKALYWKKFKEIENSKKKVLFIAVLLIAVTGFLIVVPINTNYLMYGLPLFNGLVFWILFFSVEDFVFAESILGTKLSIKDMWFSSILLFNLVSFLISLIQIAIITVSLNRFNDIGVECIFHIFVAFLTAGGLTAFSTYYISDYSKMRNFISSIGGIVNVIILAYILMQSGKISLLYKYRIYLCGISILLLGYSVVMVFYKSSSEKFVNNIKKLGQAYDNVKTLDE